jgi:hypothetical protein
LLKVSSELCDVSAWQRPFDPYLPEQDLLLPPSLRDWLPENHLDYFVSDVVDQLDLTRIESVHETEERGQPPDHPRMMAKILIYAYCMGVVLLPPHTAAWQANASKHKAMSYARMQETEKRLREEVRRLLEQAEAIDE